MAIGSQDTLSSVNIGWRLETFIAVFTSLEIIIVILRFYARSLTVKKYDTGDGLIIAALFGQIVAGSIAISSVKHAGIGQHASYLQETNPEAITIFFKYMVALSTCGLITSILRFAAFYKKSSFLDPTYDGVELGIWTVCEPGVYLMAACLIVYRPLLDKLGISVVTGNTTRGKGSSMPNSLAGKKIARSGGSGAGQSIAFRTMNSNGFSQLDDNDERPLRNNTSIRATAESEVV
ncbi:hypothetical protein LARI1_G007784 [Lachnellula arida]|uniref:Rhodopsin domain-containing protein n=1 Tax=Lachnellula arida TaxID=1316785 RepID=A0A8T9B4F0_9HELO|nr:hypothetical protein LARI1_G007784 [Lachnellula arida]